MALTRLPIRRYAAWWIPVLLLSIASALAIWISPQVSHDTRPAIVREQPESIPADQFAGLIGSLSEEDGYFSSDNFTSNETSYLHVMDALRDMNVTGGAYIGVGPEQNFTYIARMRPRIAFIVDIRRQAVLQHLLYKAVFQMSPNRVAFLSNLLSRPATGTASPAPEDSTERLVEYFRAAPAQDEVLTANLERVRSMIEKQFEVPLSARDLGRLQYVYSTFKREGLEISFRSGPRNRWGSYGRYPSLGDLILQQDLHGQLGNFLAKEDDYEFVRNLQMQNRIIPLVGDFAGSKALRGVADYLRKNGLVVRAFYTSNVEQFLFRSGTFPDFAANVRRLPIDTGSLFIRAVPMRGLPHPAHVPGHRSTTLLQKMSIFLADYDQGAYTDYWDLVTTHFMGAR
jgi:hypothetical protein